MSFYQPSQTNDQLDYLNSDNSENLQTYNKPELNVDSRTNEPPLVSKT